MLIKSSSIVLRFKKACVLDRVYEHLARELCVVLDFGRKGDLISRQSQL